MPYRLASRRNGVQLIAVSVLLGVAIVALTQCRAVNDAITGVHLTSSTISTRGTCVKKCNATYHTGQTSEDARHRIALAAASAV